MLRNLIKPLLMRYISTSRKQFVSFKLISSDEEVDGKNAKFSKLAPKFDFLKESNKYFDRLKSGFERYNHKGAQVKIDDAAQIITVSVTRVGTYRIAVDYANEHVSLLSPVSGIFFYKFDPAEKQWASVKDGHVLEDLLIREFIRHSVGLLEI